ncbi:MAG: penicillin-binding protein activator [Gammaproteobacteria bacterium]|nr:penicillin-binding protein activator [Gammaproteobacteria bacterium]
MLNGTDSEQTRASDESVWSHWLADTVNNLDTFNELGQFTLAKNYLESWIDALQTNTNSPTTSFDSLALRALKEFSDNPSVGLLLAGGLVPSNYSESGIKALILGHMHWVLQDCENTVDDLSKFSPIGAADSLAWSRKIWDVLTSWCMYRGQDDQPQHTSSAEDWWELAQLIGSSITPTQQYERFEQWKFGHANHLAALYPPLQIDITEYEKPKRLALLLPQAGSLSSAARAIRNGFLSAHLSVVGRNRSISVELYDTEESDISLLIDQVIADGVDIVVGPLDKDRVRALVRGDTLAVPVVALNRVSETAVSNSSSLQLSMVVEDDVSAIARKLQDMRAERILLFIGQDFWCARASVALKEALSPAIRIADETLLSDLSEITQSVSQVLLVAQSNSRHERLEDLIGEVEFRARRREDIDAIVAFVDYAEFGSVTAALQYHFAGDIPIVVAEPTFRDREQRVEYENGTLFTSIPATLYPNSLIQEVHGSFTDARELFPLYAFGMDAYRVALNIPVLARGDSLFGHTGVFSIRESGVISRQPIWGTVAQHSLVPAPVIQYRSRSQSSSLLSNPQ